MFNVIPEEHRKKFYIIFGILCVIAAISGGTLAWYTWQSSNNTTVSFTVGGVDVTFDAGSDITSSKLRPVSTKEVGVEKGYAIEKTITASSPVTAYLNLYLTLETLPNGLKEESFIWEIYKDNALVGKGNFKNNNQGDKITIASNQKIESATSTYKLYIWIDGTNFANPETMQNQTFKFVLNADASDQEPATETISKLLFSNSETMNNDDSDGNVRYMGANPNNYVLFNNELWRIIGVFDVASTNGGATEKRLKIIRDESIGNYSWDNKPSGTGSSTSPEGSNDWTDSALMEVLNNGAYWNRTIGTCPSGQNGATTSCNFSSIGLTEEAKNLIGDAVWNLGGTASYISASNGLASHFYGYERGTAVYSGRPTYWVGKIGLMYPSDYGYATSGGTITNRASCLAKEMYNWNNSSYSDCKNNDYLYKSGLKQWTMTPASSKSSFMFYVNGDASLYTSDRGYYAFPIRPTAYLKSSVYIVSGDGSQDNPYILTE